MDRVALHRVESNRVESNGVSNGKNHQTMLSRVRTYPFTQHSPQVHETPANSTQNGIYGVY
jgi:hypothetical protein